MGVQIQGDTGNVIATKGTYSGNVTIGGTLTYEDVTNIDSVGLITARNGIEVGARPGVAASVSVDGNAIFSGITTIGGNVKVGTGITLSPDGDAFHTGVVTATSFKGDGSQLSNITSTTINNNADNRVITGSGTANTLNGESTLTYDSGGMAITGDTDRDGYKITQSGNNYGEFMFNSNRSSAGNALGIIRSEWNSTEVASIYLSAGSDTSNKDDGQIKFYTSPDSSTGIQNRMTVDSSGNVTKPNSFHILVNLSQDYTVQNASTVNTDLVKWDRVITSQSSSGASSYFNTSTHLFTAPVAGLYYFDAAVNCDFNVQGAWLVINGSRANYSVFKPNSANTSTGNIAYKLSANDTVGLKWYEAGNTNADFFSNDLHTWWRIILLG